MISVFNSKELQAVVLAMKYADSNIRKEIYSRTREQILPDWRQTIAENIIGYKNEVVHARLDMKNTKVVVGTQGIELGFATSSKKVTSGGLVPSRHYYLAEFGADSRIAEVKGRRGSNYFYYQRKINTGWLPRSRKGRFAYKASSQIISRSVAMWVQTVVQVYYKAFESK